MSLLSLFVSDAFAQSTVSAAQQPPGVFSMLAMPLAFLVIFYLMLWRPQNKRAKQQREMLEGVKQGDEVITSGGILGRVSEVSEKFLRVMVSEGTEVTFQKNAISAVLPRGTLEKVS